MAEVTIANYRLQAYLLANAEEIIQRVGRTRRNTRFQTQLSTAQSKPGDNPQPCFLKKAVPESPGNKLDLSNFIANSLTNKEKITFIDDLPNYIRTNLYPYVNVYKTIIIGDKEADILLTTKGDQGTIQSVTANQISNPGVNIESIDIVRLGGNPAEIDTNITFKMSLYAQKLGHFFDRQKIPGNIRANFDLAQTPPEMQREFDEGVAWIDLIKKDLAKDDITIPGTELERFAKRFGIDLKDSIFKQASNGDFYDAIKQRIKVEIGYAPIPDSVYNNMKKPPAADVRERIQEMLEGQKEIYYLNLVQNEIQFNEREGTTITLDFVAATGLSTTSRSNDLLFDPWFFESELRLNDQRCKVQKTLPEPAEGAVEISEFVVDPFAETSPGLGGTAFAVARRFGLTEDNQQSVNLENFDEEALSGELDDEESKQEGLTKIQTSLDKLMILKRNLLINGLYGIMLMHSNGDDIPDEYSEDNLTLDQVKSRVYLHFAKTDHVLNKINSYLSPIESGGEPWIQNLGDVYFISEEELPGATNNDIKAGEVETLSALDNLGNQTEEEIIDALTTNDVSNIIDGDEVQIEFTFLGDLIEVALEVLAANNRFGEGSLSMQEKLFKKSTNLIYSGNNVEEASKTGFIRPFYWEKGIQKVTQDRILELHDLLGDIVVGDVTYQNPATPNEEITINIADMPIAMVEFKKWFASNIGGTRRSTFFIKDYINALLRWAVKLFDEASKNDGKNTTNVEPPEFISNKYTINSTNTRGLFVPDPSAWNNRGVSGIDESYTAIPMSTIENLANNQATNKLSPVSINVISLTPNPNLPLPVGVTRRARDREKNIPHVSVNSPQNGCVRNVTFQREDMPGLREARMFEGEDFGGTSLLREKYNASLQLEGNNFFRPGTSFYIDPSPLDLGYTDDVESFARQLGLGGYYYCIRVSHTLTLASSLDWETNIESKWNSFGDDVRFVPDPDLRPSKCHTSYLARFVNAEDLNNPSSARSIGKLADDYAAAIASRNDP
tara:strand:- start:239 stop:3271 length:3033 start_codon:yes stop_codon:yes gene_type:complete